MILKKGMTSIKQEPYSWSHNECAPVKIEVQTTTPSITVKRKRDRFHGMSEDDVLKRKLPDLLVPNLNICIVGINPGLTAAYVGHHYAGPGNHFWKCLFLSGLIPEAFNAYDDHRLHEYGIGFTNIVERTTRGSADLKRSEIAEGAEILKKKIQMYKPKIAVFNGKGIYEVFSGHKKFNFGKQPGCFPDCPETMVYVMPSSSARCSQLPRAIDKVPFYMALKKLRDHICGAGAGIDEKEFTFPDLVLKTAVKKLKRELTGSEITMVTARSPKQSKYTKHSNMSASATVSSQEQISTASVSACNDNNLLVKQEQEFNADCYTNVTGIPSRIPNTFQASAQNSYSYS